MSLRVALDFADNPRPFPSLAAPADTNGELYRALSVLATALRTKSAASVVDEAMVDRALLAFMSGVTAKNLTYTERMRAALTAALANGDTK